MADEAFKILLEEKRRALGYLPRLSETSFVVVTERDEILGIGGSTPNDADLNNFGRVFAALFSPPASVSGCTDYNLTNGTRTLYIYGPSYTYLFTGGNSGTQMQVGQGAYGGLADYNIGSAFPTSPESGRFSTGTGSWAAGTITVSGSITAGGSGTISESGLFAYWNYGTGSWTYDTFMICHDNVSPTVPFTAGKSITVQYSWSM
jgi:hypothetical protein